MDKPEYGMLTLNENEVFYFNGNDSNQQNGELWVGFGRSILVTDALFETNYKEGFIYSDFSVAGFTAVPLPGAFWILGAGLLGLVGIKRRREK